MEKKIASYFVIFLFILSFQHKTRMKKASLFHCPIIILETSTRRKIRGERGGGRKKGKEKGDRKRRKKKKKKKKKKETYLFGGIVSIAENKGGQIGLFDQFTGIVPKGWKRDWSVGCC